MYEQTDGVRAGRSRDRRLRFATLALGLALAALPSSAGAHHIIPEDEFAQRNTGGGQSLGTVSYPLEPLPKATATCRPASFDFTFASHAFVLNTAVAGFVGPVTIEGSGTSPCESAAGGVGFISTLRLSGVNMTTKNTLSCPVLAGGYTRVATEMTLLLSGNCIVNNHGQGIVNFVASLQYVPMGGTAGLLEPVTSAETTGVFAIAPA